MSNLQEVSTCEPRDEFCDKIKERKKLHVVKLKFCLPKFSKT